MLALERWGRPGRRSAAECGVGLSAPQSSMSDNESCQTWTAAPPSWVLSMCKWGRGAPCTSIPPLRGRQHESALAVPPVHRAGADVPLSSSCDLVACASLSEYPARVCRCHRVRQQAVLPRGSLRSATIGTRCLSRWSLCGHVRGCPSLASLRRFWAHLCVTGDSDLSRLARTLEKTGCPLEDGPCANGCMT
jgi:hypothetical protein